MLSNILLYEVPWQQEGWSGTICRAPHDNATYCITKENHSHLPDLCEVMQGRSYLDRRATSEGPIRRLMGELVNAPWPNWTPVVDLSEDPDVKFGRLHRGRGRLESYPALIHCPHLRPDPWCSPSLSVFKKEPTRHGLGNQLTDDSFTFSGVDYLQVLDDFPRSWRNHASSAEQRTVLGENGRFLYCLVCCKDHPLPTSDESSVLVVGALRINLIRNEGKLWQFKGDEGVRLPLQELLRFYEGIRGDEKREKELRKIFDQLPTVNHFPGKFSSITPVQADRVVDSLVTSMEEISRFCTKPGNALDEAPLFSEVDIEAFVAGYKVTPRFKYPNLGSVLFHVTDEKQSLSKHMQAYFEDTEDALLESLKEKIEKKSWNEQEKKFFLNFLIYYDIPASFMASCHELFTKDYNNHWGVIKRQAKEFGPALLKNPYLLSMGVMLKPEKEDETSYQLDFRCIDDGEQLRRGKEWVENEMAKDPQRQMAKQYDDVLRLEQEDDWAQVKIEDVGELPDEPYMLAPVVQDNQARKPKVQRTVVGKARELVDTFYDNEMVTTPDQFACVDKNEIKDEVKKGFAGYYGACFPENTTQDFDGFLTTNKGKQVNQAIEEQGTGIIAILNNRFTIITGKAGAGKSEMFKKVVEKLHELETFLFLAPTGKAVQAIKEKIDGVRDSGDKPVVPKEQYMTIAKFLVMAKATNELFEPASSEPLESFSAQKGSTLLGDEKGKPVNIIIDEASMVDLLTMGNLCHALSGFWSNPEQLKRFVLVGDINQLPPVQSGYPFRQLLLRFEEQANENTPAFGFCRLDVSLRFILGETDALHLTKYADSFTRESSVAELAPEETGVLKEQARNFFTGSFTDRESLDRCLEAVFRLELPFEEKDGYRKVSWAEGEELEQMGVAEALKENIEILQKALKEADDEGLKELGGQVSTYFLDQLQFIIPTKKDYFGVDQIKKKVQAGYPASKLIKYIQNRNDNNKEIYNGNLAVGITKKGSKKAENRLFYPDSLKVYGGDEVPESSINRAYAITVHKSQGSGFSITVAILPKSIHEGLRSREMQYTAVTRTKDVCILLFEKLTDAT